MNWTKSWKGVGVSVIGNDHVRHELPLQDASAVILSPRPAAVVCDGAGSASKSHDGANAALREFRIALSALELYIAAVLDLETVPFEVSNNAWRCVANLICCMLVAAKEEAARMGTGKTQDYDFTFAAAVVGRIRTGFIQIGDGAVCVKTRNGGCAIAIKPQKGRYVNATTFLTADALKKGAYCTRVIPTSAIGGVMVMSDGPEVAMVDLSRMRPAGVVSRMIDDFAAGELDRDALLNYLTGSRWAKDLRGGDDKSVVILVNSEKEVSK